MEAIRDLKAKRLHWSAVAELCRGQAVAEGAGTSPRDRAAFLKRAAAATGYSRNMLSRMVASHRLIDDLVADKRFEREQLLTLPLSALELARRERDRTTAAAVLSRALAGDVSMRALRRARPTSLVVPAIATFERMAFAALTAQLPEITGRREARLQTRLKIRGLLAADAAVVGDDDRLDHAFLIRSFAEKTIGSTLVTLARDGQVLTDFAQHVWLVLQVSDYTLNWLLKTLAALEYEHLGLLRLEQDRLSILRPARRLRSAIAVARATVDSAPLESAA